MGEIFAALYAALVGVFHGRSKTCLNDSVGGSGGCLSRGWANPQNVCYLD